jgi:hypothetical protein
MSAQFIDLLVLGIVKVPEAQSISEAKPILEIKPISEIKPMPEAKPVVVGPLEGALRMIAQGVPVAWTKAGEKAPPMPGFPKLATRDQKQVMQWAAENPNCNWICVARSNEYCFLDEDDSEQIRSSYEKMYEEPFPRTWTTESRPGHRQSVWKQTDATRKLGNKVQGKFKGGIMSFRQDGEYVLAAMSHLNPSEKDGTGHRDYIVVDESPIAEMPENLIDLIYSRLIPEDQAVTAKSLAANPEAMILEHHRNDTLFRVACKWRENGTSEESIRFDLQAMNENRCSPMLPREEVDCIVDGICKRYEQGDPAQDVIIFGRPNPPAGVARMEELKPFEWGTPEEITDALLPVKQFSLDYLPFCLRGWAQDVSERMSIPLDFAGVSIIVALAGAIGRRAFVYPKASDKSWKEAICVSGAICASSGKLKTPAFKVFMAPFQQLEIEWNAAYKKELASYTEAQKAYELRYKAAVKSKLEFDEEPPPEPEEPRRIILNDSTPEKAHSIMAKNSTGILLYRDEFASWVAELEKEGRESQRGLYLAAMNGNDIFSMDRIGRGSTNAIMCASLFGGFQPEMLRDFLGDSRNIHDGMLARFGGLVWPDDAWLPSIDRGENQSWKDLYNAIIRKLAAMKPESVELHFAPDAQEKFNTWRVDHIERVAKVEHVGKQSHLSKYHGLLPKLAGLLQMADLAALALKSPGAAVVNLEKGITHVNTESAGVDGRHMIDLAHLEQAIGLLTYFESHMERVYACALSPEKRALHTLAKRIQRGDLYGTFRLRDIRRKHWADLGDTRCIEFAADALVDKGWARELPAERNPAGGRPTEQWEINPRAKRL